MNTRVAVSRSVIVSTRRLSQHKVAEVRVACERLALDPVFSHAEDLPYAPNARVVVGGLGAGERRIPNELHAALCADRESALLLLCEDALVRPSVSLYAGRVALLGGEADAEAIASRLCVLFAGRDAETEEGNDECAAAGFWARVAHADAARARLFAEPSGGLTLCFAVRGAIAASDSELAALRSELGGEAGASETFERAVNAHVGTDVGVVHFAADSREWFLHWPASPKTLWMLSPTRFPALSDLSRSAGVSTRLRAASADVLIALPEALAPDRLQELSRELPRRAHLGGPAAFDLAGAALAAAPAASACVVELR